MARRRAKTTTRPENVTLAPSCQRGGSWPVLLAASAIALAALAAYANSFVGVNIYDDYGAIRENLTIRHLWPIGRVLAPPSNGETVSGRPILNLTFALNYAVGQSGVGGYHSVNLAIHIFAALLLFGILRRTLLLLSEKPKPFEEDKGSRGKGVNESRPACFLAFSVALLWVVHPLQTESVTYIVQRAESLVGFFYFLTLYCVIRGTADGEGKPVVIWHIGAVLACLLGMATKEVMVTAPLVVLLYDRTFLAGSFRGALRRRWGLYAGLAATWVLLAYLVISTGLLGQEADFIATNRWCYACTQPGVLLYYLRLCVWPHPLCLDYGWPVAGSVKDVLPPTIVVGGLIAVTLWGLIHNRPFGFLGAWFFLILAPTSSVHPLRQPAFEHRLYLSLAAVVTLAVMSGNTLGRTMLRRGVLTARSATAIGGVLVMAVALTLGFVTCRRNDDYQSDIVIWQDTVNKVPNNFVAHNYLGVALARRGDVEDAIGHYRKALELKSDFVDAHNNLGTALAGRGQVDEAIAHFRKALDINPERADAHNNLGIALAGRGQVDEAIAHSRRALEIQPDKWAAHNYLGLVLAGRGDVEDAIGHYRKALELKPDYADAYNNIAWIRATHPDPKFRDGLEAVTLAQQALELSSSNANSMDTLAAAYAEAGRFAEAVQTAGNALNLATQQNQHALAESIQAKIRLYTAGKPFRESPNASAKTSIQP